MNFRGGDVHCSLIHFVPHLLKTLELFNYSFNVFISIVSGKHGRYELLNMLLCRTKTLPSNSYPSSTHRLSVSTQLQVSQQRLNRKSDENILPTRRLLLENNYS